MALVFMASEVRKLESGAALLEGAQMPELWVYIWPTLLLALITVPAGLKIFSMAEHYSKRRGKLARNG